LNDSQPEQTQKKVKFVIKMNTKCTYCGFSGHLDDKCYNLHPELCKHKYHTVEKCPYKKKIDTSTKKDEDPTNDSIDSLTSNFATINIDAPKYLFLDCANFSADFLRTSLEKTQNAITNFVHAAENANFHLEVFCDFSRGSDEDESRNKWKERRQKEVDDGEKRVPMSLNAIISGMFASSLGPGRVHCSSIAANDDTLAAHAHHHNAYILSQDKDFFRYENASYSVFSGFSINEGALVLEPHRLANYRPGSPEALLAVRGSLSHLLLPPPAFVDRVIIPDSPFDINLFAIDLVPPPRSYWQGVPSPLIRKLKFNPHVKVLPLRRALYARLWSAEDDDKLVREVFPSWCTETGTFIWYDERVKPLRNTDPDFPFFDSLLHDELKAFTHFFPHEAANDKHAAIAAVSGNALIEIDDHDWQNHVWGCRMVIFELCAVAQRKELLELIERDKDASRVDFSIWPCMNNRRDYSPRRGGYNNRGGTNGGYARRGRY
jgi:predicted nucleic acid-binding protein